VRKEDVDEYLNKEVLIALKNNFVYKGKVLEISDFFLTLLDKNNDKIKIDPFEITAIKEVKDG